MVGPTSEHRVGFHLPHPPGGAEHRGGPGLPTGGPAWCLVLLLIATAPSPELFPGTFTVPGAVQVVLCPLGANCLLVSTVGWD